MFWLNKNDLKRKVPFNVEKIAKAIYKAAVAVGGKDYEEAEELATKVCKYVEKTQNEECPTVEKIQDAVEHVLNEELALEMKQKLIEQIGECEILVRELPAVVGAHMGIGGIGYQYIRKYEE